MAGSSARSVRSIKLILETLEDRVTPSTYIWTGAGGSTAFQTPGNWRVLETGAVATKAPDPGTDCAVWETSPGVNISIDGAGVACRSFSVAAKWAGDVVFSKGGVLNIWGANGANSNIWNGRFVVPNAADKGAIDIHGGQTYYDDLTLDWDTGNEGQLDVYTDNAGYFIVGPDCSGVGASFHVGWNVTGNVDGGFLRLETNYSTQNYIARTGTSIQVSTVGAVTFDVDSTLNNTSITSAGVIRLSDGSYVGLAPTQSLTVTGGGMLIAPDSGRAEIDGTVSITNGWLRMGEAADEYSTLYIDGDLAMQGSIFSFDVQTDTAGISDLVDVLGNITLTNGCVSYCYTWGDPTAGGGYQPMWSEAMGFTGTFSFTAWLGDGKSWTEAYTTDGYFLS